MTLLASHSGYTEFIPTAKTKANSQHEQTRVEGQWSIVIFAD